MRNAKVSVVVPVFNEEGTIEQILDQLAAVDLEMEIIVVDDGSTDRTREILGSYTGHKVAAIYNSLINIGKGAAVRIGLEHVTGDIVVIQDADTELNPHQIPQLVAPIQHGIATVVYGSRFLGNNKFGSLTGYIGNKFLTFATNVLYRARITDMETCYKVFPASLIPELKLKALKFDLEPEMTAKFLKLGHRIMELPIEYNPRTEEEGKKIRWWDGFSALWTLLRWRIDKYPRT